MQDLVKEKGMQFSIMMVKSLLSHEKNHTRRAGAELKVINKNPDEWQFIKEDCGSFIFNHSGCENIFIKPRYKVGEVVYIKEIWTPIYASQSYEYPGEWYCFEWDENIRGKLEKGANNLRIVYKADNFKPPEVEMGEIKWRSSMFLPKCFARPNRYEIISVRPQRINMMTDEEAMDEGMNARVASYLGLSMMNYTKDGGQYYLRIYKAYWDFLNAKNGKPFSAGMWVWDYGMKEIT